MSASKRLAERRRVLKGMLGGTVISVGLPFLDAFLNNSGTAMASTGRPLPVVYGTWYWGLGFNPGFWEPTTTSNVVQSQVSSATVGQSTTTGKIAEFGPESMALNAFKDKINLYSGMKVHLDGRPAITHFTGNMSTLTGTTPRSNGVGAATIDTLIADHISNTTRFKSLEMSATGNPTHMYSYRAGGVLQAAEVSPAALYTRIFGAEFKDPNAADFKVDPAVLARQSVLSAVKEPREALQKSLGASDRARLDEYFTSLRQLEQQLDLQLQKPEPLQACTRPEAVKDGPVGAEIETVVANHKLFAKLIAHAFACDQTRVANLAFSDMTSSLRRAGSPMIYHIYTHEEPIDEKLGYQPNVRYFIQRVTEGFVDYLTALSSFREGDQTLLDRALIFAATDTGYAKVHSLENIPMITAGSAGGRMKTGFHVVAKGDPVTRVGLTIQQALGLSINSWGTDSMSTSKTITEVLA
jgi:hypothetical protein